MYIQFKDTTVTTKHLAEGIAADYDAQGRLAGIEILDAMKRWTIPRHSARLSSRILLLPDAPEGEAPLDLQFEPNQSFQLDGRGYPALRRPAAGQYAVIHLGAIEGLFAGQERAELGVGNRLLLAEDKLRANLRVVQTRNDIEVTDPAAAPEAWEPF